MTIQQQIKAYIAGLPASAQSDMITLDRLIRKTLPGCKLWFLDGKNSEGKIVSNPNIGYGEYTIEYANGKTKPFYQIGISANTSGISVYIMSFTDKAYLAATYGKKIGKARVTGYCIQFKALKDIHTDILQAAILDGAGASDKV